MLLSGGSTVMAGIAIYSWSSTSRGLSEMACSMTGHRRPQVATSISP
jgi:hypothetical protein